MNVIGGNTTYLKRDILLFIIKRLKLLVPLLLIDPLFINHSHFCSGVLGVWGFGVMG